ncbi:MAG: restriction endonuclease subunit S [Coriobacteriales bacterium]|jgi:type I restriction enzyme S subunit|nr:restriction endonuclease subunit S [Coriobacteriales bacterium]
MRTERTAHQLADIIDLIGGGTPKTSIPEYWDGEIPWLSVKDFNNDDRYVYSTEKSITQTGFNNSSSKMLAHDDIIISARGTVGELAMIPFPMAFNQSCYGIRGKKGAILQTYLYYLLKDSIRLLENQTHGSVFDTITRNAFANIKVNLPMIHEQQTVADTLTALDDKIAANKRINHRLEQMAQAIWSERFGGLEPNGKLGEVIEIFDSKRVPLSGSQREKMDKTYPYYGAAALMDYVDDYLFDGIYLLLGEDGSVIDDSGFPVLQYVWGKFWVNNHAHILQGRNGFTVESLYVLLSQTGVASIITGAVQPKINQANLKALEVVIPSRNEMVQFNDTVDSLFVQIRNHHDENLRLAALRDTLLPRLMSGELSVADAGVKR